MPHRKGSLGSIRMMPAVLAMLLLRAPAALGQIEEEAAVDFAKRTLASELDSALPKQPFGAWFTQLMGPTAEVFWEMNDCGEQTGDPAIDSQRDLPVCVGAEAQLEDGREILAILSVGTWETGLAKAVVRDVYWAQGREYHPLKRLSELPALVRSEPPDSEDEAGEQEDKKP
ncbi:MAG TPA: hypothetical protein VIC04_06280 [Terriglobia bacterium]